MIIQIAIFFLMLVKVVTEFLSLVYISLCEKLVRKLLNEGVLDSAMFSLDAEEGRTLFVLIFLPICNFISDLIVCIAIDVSFLIPYMLLLEMFMPMISYYTGEILSRGIRNEHVKSVEYRDVRLSPYYGFVSIVRRIPIITLNEKLISRTVKLIYVNYSTILSLHLLFLFTCIAVYLTSPK